MYPGNSMGGVLLITTKMPDKLEATVKETVSIQPWQQYGTKNTYATTQTTASVGCDRKGRVLAARSPPTLSDGYLAAKLDLYDQRDRPRPGPRERYVALNKQGVVADVIVKPAPSSTPSRRPRTSNWPTSSLLEIQGAYTLGVWNNRSHVQSCKLT